MKSVKSIEEFFALDHKWSEELLILRELFHQTELTETLKWGIPIYTINRKNIAGMTAFKSYVGIWFYQGVFLKDGQNKLINAQEGITKALRQWRFASIEEIKTDKNLILSYIEEAIVNHHLGKELKPNLKKPLEIPLELQAKLSEDKKLNDTFHALSLSKKREFAEYISTAKRTETKEARSEKIIPLILAGKGLNDKYK